MKSLCHCFLFLFLQGYVPKEEILYKYNLTQFVGIVRSVR